MGASLADSYDGLTAQMEDGTNVRRLPNGPLRNAFSQLIDGEISVDDIKIRFDMTDNQGAELDILVTNIQNEITTLSASLSALGDQAVQDELAKAVVDNRWRHRLELCERFYESGYTKAQFKADAGLP